MKFVNYYTQYIGITEKNEKNVFFSKFRDFPINKHYYYPVIRSLYNNREYLSLSPSLQNLSDRNIKDIAVVLSQIHKDIAVKNFFRFSLHKKLNNSKITDVVLVKQEHKPFFMNSGKNLNPDFKEQKWKELQTFIDRGYFFATIKENKFVSSCRISDIYCGGANLVVYTDENFRCCGYGKEVVKLAANYCIQYNLLPVYYVETDNTASVKLAKSLNFSLCAEEESICYKCL